MSPEPLSRHEIRLDEVEITAIRAQRPGGQNVNTLFRV